MEWLALNGSTAVVLLIVLTVVCLIVRSMIRNRGLGCDGCSGGCTGCKGECPAKPIELTEEQKAKLKDMGQGSQLSPRLKG